MAFSDQPPPSLLRIWPLIPLGRWATRKLHRATDGPEGGLVSAKYYITKDVAWRLGQAYLGALGLLALPLTVWYLNAFHQDTGYVIGNRRILGHWNELPLDLKVIMPVMFILHFIGVVSLIRCFLVAQELRPVSETP